MASPSSIGGQGVEPYWRQLWNHRRPTLESAEPRRLWWPGSVEQGEDMSGNQRGSPVNGLLPQAGQAD